MPYPIHSGQGPVDEYAAKRERNERALDAACGIVPEQREQSRPTRPGHAVRLVPFETILSRVLTQPGMPQHLEGIDLDGDGIPDIPPHLLMGPPPAHPMERMQWQTLLENRQRQINEARQRRARRKESGNQALLRTLRENDPLFTHVTRWIENFVDSLPGRISHAVIEQVDKTPGAFLEMYRDLRKHFIEDFPMLGTAAPARPVQGMPARSARPVPPDLQRPGLDEDAGTTQAERAAELAALKARCRAGKAREGDLLRYLELIGV